MTVLTAHALSLGQRLHDVTAAFERGTITAHLRAERSGKIDVAESAGGIGAGRIAGR